MPCLRRLVVLLSLALAPAASAAPRVAVDIAPIESIAAHVMEGVGTPDLILPPGASPHAYALRPSEAGRLQDADLVVWVGPALTPWLADPITALAADASLVTVADLPGLTILPVRDGGAFEADDDDHAGAVDPHLWLDPENAAVIARALATALTAADPENGAAYAANAEDFAAGMDALVVAIDSKLAPVHGRRFIVFHDAYQYFEDPLRHAGRRQRRVAGRRCAGRRAGAGNPRPASRRGYRMRLRRTAVRAASAGYPDRGYRRANLIA